MKPYSWYPEFVLSHCKLIEFIFVLLPCLHRQIHKCVLNLCQVSGFQCKYCSSLCQQRALSRSCNGIGKRVLHTAEQRSPITVICSLLSLSVYIRHFSKRKYILEKKELHSYISSTMLQSVKLQQNTRNYLWDYGKVLYEVGFLRGQNG